MTSNLLLMAWPYEGEILTSFRFSSGYAMPDVYAGNATLTQISSAVNATHYTLLFRCQGCLAWNHNGGDGVGADQRQAAGARVGPGGRGAGEPVLPGGDYAAAARCAGDLGGEA